jgi:hypothetical protein
MVSKCKLFKIITLHVKKLNCKESVYGLEDRVGEEVVISN